MGPENHDLDLSELRTLSAQEVADATGVPIETVWSAAKNGSLYGRKLGREWRFTIPAIREWIGISQAQASSVPDETSVPDAGTAAGRKKQRRRTSPRGDDPQPAS